MQQNLKCNNIITQHTNGGNNKSVISCTSDSEVVSSSRIKNINESTNCKENYKKGKRLYKTVFNPVGREKARARARERTREKMMKNMTKGSPSSPLNPNMEQEEEEEGGGGGGEDCSTYEIDAVNITRSSPNIFDFSHVLVPNGGDNNFEEEEFPWFPINLATGNVQEQYPNIASFMNISLVTQQQQQKASPACLNLGTQEENPSSVNVMSLSNPIYLLDNQFSSNPSTVANNKFCGLF